MGLLTFGYIHSHLSPSLSLSLSLEFKFKFKFNSIEFVDLDKSMESANSSVGSLCHQYHHQSLLPPGFRFHPTDEELVVHYLKKKTVSAPLPVSIITEIDLYKFDPWELPAKAVFGEQEWYFFSPRERKYPNGARPNRAATSGYWKATGTDKAIMTGGGTKRVGIKKALVFYGGKPPKGIKTNWIMHEYRLTDNKAKSLACDITNKKSSLKLDDWVLCRIYKKNHDYTTSDHIIGSLQQHDQKLPALNAHHLFDRMSLINTSISSHLGCSAASERRLLAAAGANSIAQFWNDDVEASPARRFLEDGNGDGGSSGSINECGSIASLLSQFPQTPPTLNQQSLLGSIGDGLMRQPYQLHGLNW